MKVNQIVSEHKKGVRAHIYNKKATTKAQGTVPLYGPDKQEAKMTPYKAPKAKPVMEDPAPVAPGTSIGKIEKVDPATKQATIKTTSGEETQVALDQTAKVDDKTVAVPPPPNNPQELVGDNVVAKEGGIFSDPTNPQIEAIKTMLADPRYASNPVFKAQLEKRLKIALDRASLDQGMAAGRDGQPKPVLNPEEFAKANPTFKESETRKEDDALLDKMLTIAGLR